MYIIYIYIYVKIMLYSYINTISHVAFMENSPPWTHPEAAAASAAADWQIRDFFGQLDALNGEVPNLLKMAIEIVDFPINSMVIFHSFLYVYQRVNGEIPNR